MDPRLVRLYEDELAHLRESGRDFAREHPKIARRLALDPDKETEDPYVERLLEGFAFLTARVRLKMEAEQPQLISQLLESLYPNFAAPLPSMLIARLAIDEADPNLARGWRVARGSALLSLLPRGQETRCEFRTAMDVTLWPLAITQVQCFSHAPALQLARLPAARAAQGGLRIRLRAGGGLLLNQIGADRLTFHLSGADDTAYALHERLLGQPLGTLLVRPDQPADAQQWRGADSIAPVGFAEEEALLPTSLRAFSGHRLLQEVAALPQRLLFFEIADLAPRLAALRCAEADLVVLFGTGVADLEPLVDTQSVALYCTPAVNLFEKRLDRVALGPGSAEYHVVADRTRPMDFEVHSLRSVAGFGAGNEALHEFTPLYGGTHAAPAAGAAGHGHYTLRREPRRTSARQRQQGARVPGYLGEEVFVSLVDAEHGPYRDSLRQLSVLALASNRDLPALLPTGSAGAASVEEAPQWQLDAPGPVTGVRCLRGPTRPRSRQPDGAAGWQLVEQLTHNHLALGDDAAAAAAALRATLALYGAPHDSAWAQQVAAVRALHVRHVVRRLPLRGPLSFGSGSEIVLELDDEGFHGASAFLLASVLERWFARHAAINSFTQFSLRTAQRGLVKAWPPRAGQRQVA